MYDDFFEKSRKLFISNTFFNPTSVLNIHIISSSKSINIKQANSFLGLKETLIEIKIFMLFYNRISGMGRSMFRNKFYLKTLNLKNCLTEKFGWNIYYFSDYLENIEISGNYLKVFPIFCSDYSRSRVCKLEELNIA